MIFGDGTLKVKYNEKAQLLYEQKKKNNLNKWKLHHTIIGILLLMFGNVNAVVLNIYYRDFQLALNVTNVQFSYIIIFTYIGGAMSVLIFPFINHLLLLQNRITIFSFLCGVFGILFPIPIVYFNFNNRVTLILCCINRLFFGITFSFYKTSVIDFATISVDPSRKGLTVGLLELSWSFVGLNWFIIGYVIQYINWWLPFVIYGVLLCVLAIISHFSYKKFNKQQLEEINEESVWINDMKTVFSNKHSLLIFLATFIMEICKGSFGVIVAGVWMEDVYNLTASQVGWITLTIFLSELIANVIVSFIVDKYGAVLCGWSGAINVCFAGCLTMFCFIYFDDANIGSIYTAIIVIFFLYFGFEIIVVVNIVFLVTNNTMNKKLASLILLVNYFSSNVGLIIGTYISPSVWNDGAGLGKISSIWIVCPIVTIFIYLLMKFMNKQETKEKQQIEMLTDE